MTAIDTLCVGILIWSLIFSERLVVKILSLNMIFVALAMWSVELSGDVLHSQSRLLCLSALLLGIFFSGLFVFIHTERNVGGSG